MNIMILTIGTRGDVQPYVALGLGLQAAGYNVTLCTGAGFEAFVTGYGLRFAPLRADFLQLLDTSEGRASLGAKNPAALLKKVMPMLRGMIDDAWAAAPGTDAVIYHPKALAGYHIADKLGIPAFLSLPCPAYSPTRAFPSPILGVTANLGGLINKWSYKAVRLATAPYQGMINEWRRDVLGLPAVSARVADGMLHGRPVPRLYCYSPQVVPTPADWDTRSTATGYWFLDPPAGWQPPADLVRFLAAGPAPVYAGFGSMVARDPVQSTRTILDALRQAGQRGILATGRAGLTGVDLPDTVYAVESVPHDWLFPQVAAVVHHGGAGTTAAAAQAGKPMVICPFFGDQPFWGKRAAALGVAPPPIPQKKLTAANLAQAITSAVTGDALRDRATRLGAAIRAEPGVARAVQVIGEEIAAHRRAEPLGQVHTAQARAS